MSRRYSTAWTRSLRDVLADIGPAPIVSVANRSIAKLVRGSDGRVIVRRTAGGLGPSMRRALERSKGALVYATASTEMEEQLASQEILTSQGSNIWLRFVRVPQRTFREFYSQISNGLLYAVLHGRPELARDTQDHGAGEPSVYNEEIRSAFEEGYRWVNREYGRLLVSELSHLERPRVLIHDHHFALLPRILREQGFRGRITFFLHIPWPSARLLDRVLPPEVIQELVAGIMGSDRIGLHTNAYARNFRSTMSRFRAKRASDSFADGSGRAPITRTVSEVAVCPLPVDAAWLSLRIHEPLTLDFAQLVRHRAGERILVVRAERIDLMKGLLEGLRAFELIFEDRPSMRRRLQLLAMLEPSRLEIPKFRSYFERVNSLATSINEKHGGGIRAPGVIRTEADRLSLTQHDEWPPVVLFECPKHHDEVLAAMAAADIGWFSSIADGLNLSIKEFGVMNGPEVISTANSLLSRRFGKRAVRLNPGVAVCAVTLGAFEEARDAVLPLRSPKNVRAVVSSLMQAVKLVEDHKSCVRLLSRRLSDRFGQGSLDDWLNRLLEEHPSGG
jgi:trehalose 6-phosphate synthase